MPREEKDNIDEINIYISLYKPKLLLGIKDKKWRKNSTYYPSFPENAKLLIFSLSLFSFSFLYFFFTLNFPLFFSSLPFIVIFSGITDKMERLRINQIENVYSKKEFRLKLTKINILIIQ